MTLPLDNSGIIEIKDHLIVRLDPERMACNLPLARPFNPVLRDMDDDQFAGLCDEIIDEFGGQMCTPSMIRTALPELLKADVPETRPEQELLDKNDNAEHAAQLVVIGRILAWAMISYLGEDDIDTFMKAWKK